MCSASLCKIKWQVFKWIFQSPGTETFFFLLEHYYFKGNSTDVFWQKSLNDVNNHFINSLLIPETIQWIFGWFNNIFNNTVLGRMKWIILLYLGSNKLKPVRDSFFLFKRHKFRKWAIWQRMIVIFRDVISLHWKKMEYVVG